MVPIKKKEVKSKTGSWLETYLAKRSPEPKKWRYSAEIADMVDKKGCPRQGSQNDLGQDKG
jgi:hypothetical protein